MTADSLPIFNKRIEDRIVEINKRIMLMYEAVRARLLGAITFIAKAVNGIRKITNAIEIKAIANL